MTPTRSIIVAVLLAAASFGATTWTPGRNSIPVRGQAQDVYYFPAAVKSHGKVLFTPGDGGWRGAAIDMAKNMASWGFDVFGWDTKRYLKSFTTDTGTLAEQDIGRDFAAMRAAVSSSPSEKIILVGWSQGAAMSLIPASTASLRDGFAGLVTIGLPESGVLGWRWSDDITYVTKKEPNEPKFRTAPYMASVAPLPLYAVQAIEDEYTPRSAFDALLNAAREPKRFAAVPGTHNFSGHTTEFFTRLKEGLEWVLQHKP